MNPRERETQKFPFSPWNTLLKLQEQCLWNCSVRRKARWKILQLRMSGHVSSMNRTSIVEDCAEDEFAHWATDEVTGEQGYIDDERSCFWTWDVNEYAWQSRPFKGRQVKRRQGQGKGKGKGRSKKIPEEHSLAMNKQKIMNGGQKRTLLGGPKERKAKKKKACQKAMMALRRVVVALWLSPFQAR